MASGRHVKQKQKKIATTKFVTAALSAGVLATGGAAGITAALTAVPTTESANEDVQLTGLFDFLGSVVRLRRQDRRQRWRLVHYRQRR